MMAKKNPFCKRLKPSDEISSVIGEPTTGITAVAAGIPDDAVEDDFSSTSPSPA